MERVLDSDHRALGTALDHADGLRLLEIPDVFIEADFPGVLGARHVLEGLQKVAATSRRHGFLAIGFVDQARDAAGARIDFEAEKLVLDIGAINL
jgi:hypothetical protein